MHLPRMTRELLLKFHCHGGSASKLKVNSSFNEALQQRETGQCKRQLFVTKRYLQTNASTMVHRGKCKTRLSRQMIEMPLVINYRLRSKTSCMSHISHNNQTPTAWSGKMPVCISGLIRRLWGWLKNNMGENIAEGEEIWDNLTGLFLTKHNKTPWDCSNLCYRL